MTLLDVFGVEAEVHDLAYIDRSLRVSLGKNMIFSDICQRETDIEDTFNVGTTGIRTEKLI